MRSLVNDLVTKVCVIPWEMLWIYKWAPLSTEGLKMVFTNLSNPLSFFLQAFPLVSSKGKFCIKRNGGNGAGFQKSSRFFFSSAPFSLLTSLVAPDIRCVSLPSSPPLPPHLIHPLPPPPPSLSISEVKNARLRVLEKTHYGQTDRWMDGLTDEQTLL